MKKYAVIIIIVLSAVLYAQPKPIPIAIEVGPAQTVVKIDEKVCEMTTIYKQQIEKQRLLEDKQRLEQDIERAQQEIAKIDSILEVFK